MKMNTKGTTLLAFKLKNPQAVLICSDRRSSHVDTFEVLCEERKKVAPMGRFVIATCGSSSFGRMMRRELPEMMSEDSIKQLSFEEAIDHAFNLFFQAALEAFGDVSKIKARAIVGGLDDNGKAALFRFDKDERIRISGSYTSMGSGAVHADPIIKELKKKFKKKFAAKEATLSASLDGIMGATCRDRFTGGGYCAVYRSAVTMDIILSPADSFFTLFGFKKHPNPLLGEENSKKMIPPKKTAMDSFLKKWGTEFDVTPESHWEEAAALLVKEPVDDTDDEADFENEKEFE